MTWNMAPHARSATVALIRDLLPLRSGSGSEPPITWSLHNRACVPGNAFTRSKRVAV
jgi:hypothetical protein